MRSGGDRVLGAGRSIHPPRLLPGRAALRWLDTARHQVHPHNHVPQKMWRWCGEKRPHSETAAEHKLLQAFTASTPLDDSPDEASLLGNHNKHQGHHQRPEPRHQPDHLHRWVVSTRESRPTHTHTLYSIFLSPALYTLIQTHTKVETHPEIHKHSGGNIWECFEIQLKGLIVVSGW